MPEISFVVNGKPVRADVPPNMLLAEFLRHGSGLPARMWGAIPRNAAPASCT